MRVRLHIDAIAIEADWPRSARPEFADRLNSVLAHELTAAARRGAFADNTTARCNLTLPAAALTSAAGAGSGIARTIAGAVIGASTKS